MRNPRFRECVADIAAPLHGRPKDELIGEDIRQHRRRVRLARSAVAVLGALVLVAATTAFVALQQRNTARAERDRATSRRLAAEANANFDRRLDLAALLALEAYRIEPTFEARSAAITAVHRTERLIATLHGDPGAVTSVALSADGAILASGSEGGAVDWWTCDAAGDSAIRFEATSRASLAWPSAPMGGRSPRRVRTGRCAYGTSSIAGYFTHL